MKIVAYARIENDNEKGQFEQRLKLFAGEKATEPPTKIFYDGLSGIQFFRRALRLAPGADFFCVNRLEDMGRDGREMLENINAFAASERPTLFVLEGGWAFDRSRFAFCNAILNALTVFGQRNRRLGVRAAIATGARIGRPTLFTLDGVRKTIEDLMDARKGRFPSVRELAKEVACGKTVAARLLNEYKNEQAPKFGVG